MKFADVGRLTERTQHLRSYLAKPGSSWAIAISAMALLWSTVFSGLMIDDFLQRLVAQGRLPLPGGPLNLFAFVRRDPPWRAILLETGAYPWWIGLKTQFIYFRPLASITHFIDYRWWPRAAWLMHIENLAWYGALILLSAKFYRRFVRLPWAAGLATAFYAFDQAHAPPVSWICNRNALMATVFGLVAMIAHDEWRAKGRRSCAVARRGGIHPGPSVLRGRVRHRRLSARLFTVYRAGRCW